jgi:hypothetical protein
MEREEFQTLLKERLCSLADDAQEMAEAPELPATLEKAADVALVLHRGYERAWQVIGSILQGPVHAVMYLTGVEKLSDRLPERKAKLEQIQAMCIAAGMSADEAWASSIEMMTQVEIQTGRPFMDMKVELVPLQEALNDPDTIHAFPLPGATPLDKRKLH